MNAEPLDLVNLTRGQHLITRALREHSGSLFTWVSPVRQGKTVGCVLGLVELGLLNLALEVGNHVYIIGGKSLGSITRIVEPYITDICEQYGVTCQLKSDKFSHYFEVAGHIKYYLFGGDNARSFQAVRGMKIHSAWIDEATLCDKVFVETVIQRGSYEDSMVVLTTNPDAPVHWLKDWLDKPRPNQVDLFSPAGENQHFPEAKWEDLAGGPQDYMHKRNIEGVWAAPEGLVFPTEEWMFGDLPEGPMEGYIGFDWGGGGVTAALLAVWRGDVLWIAREYYHRASDGVLTDEEHLDNVCNLGFVQRLISDPTCTTFKALARTRGIPVENASNNIKAGVRCVLNALWSGQLKISRTCVNLRRELGVVIWDSKTGLPMAGQDDHATDDLRYLGMRMLPAAEYRYG